MRCTSRPTAASAPKTVGSAGPCGAALGTDADCLIFGAAAEIVESETVEWRATAERAARVGRCGRLTDVARAVTPAAEPAEDVIADGAAGDTADGAAEDCSVSAEAGVESAIATAVPTPSAAASAPTRPT
jgi:hypothetical protein